MARIIEAGDLLKKKKKKVKAIEEDKPKKKKKKVKVETEVPKKKKKKVIDEDTPKKKKKKVKVETEDKPKKKKKKVKAEGQTSKTSSRDREAILKNRSKIKEHKTPISKAVKTDMEVAASEEENQALAKEFEAAYGEHLTSLSVEDQEQMQEYFTMFHKLSKIARRFEVKAQSGSSKDVYALMKIYDQMREIIADLKALKDISQIADKLQEDVLIPYSRVLVAELSTIRASALKAGNRLLKPEDQKAFQEAFDSALISSSQKLEEAFNSARVAIIDIYAE